MKRFLLIALCLTLMACSNGGAINITETMNMPTYSSEQQGVKYALGSVLVHQREMDAYIDNLLKDKSYTLEEPAVLVNPYAIAPMTALLIFQTPKETEIQVDVNGVYKTTMEKGKEHAIPIYGMYADYKNQITLSDENGNSTVIEIPLEAYTGAVVTVEETSPELPIDEFFLVSPDYENTSAYDRDGKLVWYLATGDNEGAVVFLENGHFLISDPNQGTNGIRINYSGFLEMDYLGKIHKQYIPEYGYHHEIEFVHDGTDLLISGHDEQSQFRQGIVYIVDGETLAIKQELDLAEVLKRVDADWVNSFGNPFNVVINGISYNENTHDIVLSPRALDMLININMDTQEIKWILADPGNLPESFTPYLLTRLDETRYPKGQHNCQFLDDTGTLIAYHDNDTSITKEKDQELVNFLDRRSTNQIIRVNEEEKTVETIWEYGTTYDDGTSVFSKMSGSLEFLPNGNKLFSYGSAVKQEAYTHPETSLITDNLLTNGLMVEVDSTDKTLWKATFPGVMHKVYKDTFYDEITENYQHGSFQKIDGQYFEKHEAHQVSGASLLEKFAQAESFAGEVDAFVNRLIVTMEEYPEDKQIDVFFVNDKQEIFMKTYKNKGELPAIVNSGRYGVQITIPEGKYKVYIKEGNKYYNPETEIIFE